MPFISIAQTDITDDKNIHQNRLILKLDSVVALHLNQKPLQFSTQTEGVNEIFDLTKEKSAKFLNQQKQLNAENELLKNDYGINLDAGFRENFEYSIFGVEDIFYRRRIQLGLEWNLLNNGFFENRHKLKKLDLEKRMLNMEFESDLADENYEDLYNRLISYFNFMQTKVARSHLNAVSDHLDIAITLFHLGYIKWEQVLNLTSTKARLETKLKTYQNYNAQFDTTTKAYRDLANFPVFEIDLNKLLAHKKMMLPKEGDIEHSLGKLPEYNPLTDISLSLFSRYNYFQDTDDQTMVESVGGREYFSAGIDLSIPLPFNYKQRKTLEELEHEQKVLDLKDQHESTVKEIYNHYYEYRHDLQNYIQFYKNYKVQDEKIQIHAIRGALSSEEYSPALLIDLLSTRYDIALELLEIQRLLYLKLLKIYSYVYDKPLTEFVTPIDITSYFTPKFEASGIYIWSNTLQEYSNSMLLNYLVYHGFSSVSVSAGPDSTLWDKTSNFFTLAAKQGLYTELLVGDNNLIFPEREQELKSVIQKASDLGAKAVHLDVEPHTFDDWENREEFYLARYVDMLNKADSLTQLRGLQLSVSVPHYYEDIIVEIDSLTTSITFMVYEVTDTETLIERMNKELKVTGPDIEIALRPEDFRTIPELNAFVREIRSATGIARFRIHDLGSMLTIDKVELEGN